MKGGNSKLTSVICIFVKTPSDRSFRVSIGVSDGDLDTELLLDFRDQFKVNSEISHKNPYFGSRIRKST